MNNETLLGADDPPVFEILRADGRSDFVLTCDHAGLAIPRKLAGLDLPEEVFATHVASDLGVAELGRRLCVRLDAFLIAHNYSRLVIDPNRPPEARDSIVTLSERTRVPANDNLAPNEVRQRVEELLEPYQRRIADELDRRAASGRRSVLVTLHSFTPVFHGEVRPWHVGVLYGRDARLAHRLLAALRADPALVVGDNQPYSVNDASDYTVVVHGERRGIEHVEIEVRQDLLADDAGIESWAERLAAVLEVASMPA